MRASHSYSTVLALIAGTFVVAAASPDSAWDSSALLLLASATLVAALWTVGVASFNSWRSLTFVGLTIVAAAINVLTDDSAAAATVALLTATCTLGTAIVIARGVLEQGEVNRESVRGAICIYVLLGMIFMFVYGAMASIGSHALFTQGTDGTRSIRLYFSFVTLETLGYGDYTLASSLGHTLAVLEALVGQLYLVTIVALLVSRLGRKESRGSSRQGDAAGGGVHEGGDSRPTGSEGSTWR